MALGEAYRWNMHVFQGFHDVLALLPDCKKKGPIVADGQGTRYYVVSPYNIKRGKKRGFISLMIDYRISNTLRFGGTVNISANIAN